MKKSKELGRADDFTHYIGSSLYSLLPAELTSAPQYLFHTTHVAPLEQMIGEKPGVDSLALTIKKLTTIH